MKLFVDGQCFQSTSRNRGIGRYALELLQTIIREHSDIEVHVSLNAQMAEAAIAARMALSDLLPSQQIHTWHSLTTGGEAQQGYTAERRLSEFVLAHHINCIGPDVALSLSPFEGADDPAVPLLPTPLLRAPLIGVFYDGIPARYRREYLHTKTAAASYDRRMKACRDFADLLCISDFSLSEAKDLLDKDFGINISAGVSDELENLISKDDSNMPSSDRVRIIYVGALDWRKNVAIIPKALSLLPEGLRNSLEFIMAGDHLDEHVQQMKEIWSSLALPPSTLKFVGHVTDRQLVELYRSASIMIQPSFMEGFGLTALEAILCGTPVLASRAGALPEVVGLDHLLFDPNSPESLADAIRNVLSNSSIREEIAQRREIISNQFNWSNSARLSADLLRKHAEKVSPLTDIKDLRRKALPYVSAFTGETRSIANSLALAEPAQCAQSRVIVDATATIRTDLRTGIQRVVMNVCDQLKKTRSYKEHRFEITYSDDESGRYLAASDLTEPPAKAEERKVIPGPSDCILMLDSSWDLSELHKPYLMDARIRGAEVISCLYDTVPLKLPAFTVPQMPPVFRHWLLAALSVSTGFVCISKAVADELYVLLEDLNYPHPMKIGYWRLGADFMPLEGSDNIRSMTKSLAPSFLMVGTLEPRKGHAVALDAFDMAWKAGHDVQLTIVGMYGWSADGIADRIRNHPELGKRLHWHNKLQDSELCNLYIKCDALIAASYAEGFGLPIVEAGKFGVPIIASDIPVFREVAAGAPDAHFFDVGSADSLYKVIRKFLANHCQGLRTANAEVPDWPNWAQSTAELIDVILGDNWQMLYQPEMTKRYQSPSLIGRTSEDKIIGIDNRAHELRVVEGPTPLTGSDNIRLTVSVTNKSDSVWFGEGDSDGNFGVALSYHIIGKNGQVLRYENPRSSIVLALHPGDTHYLPVIIPTSYLDAGAEKIELELVQDGVAWWGSPISVRLKTKPKHVRQRVSDMNL